MTRTRSVRGVVAAGLLLALLLAGVASYYASTAPDGLNRVAEDVGFASAEQDSAAADSPLADYNARGVDDERVSGGVAGVLGVLATLVVAGGGFWLLRDRRRTD